jgi:hypothetical protein
MSSNINPNNIDGTYPVAGQDNNSQGFRDNFTNIKTNFQYAEDEISELQSKALLKSALTGTTLDNDMLGSLIYNATIADFGATRLAFGTVSGSQTINYALGHFQTLTTAGSVSLAFTNFPTSGIAGVVSVQITVASTAHTLTLPAAVSVNNTGIVGLNPSTNVITFATTGTYTFQFVSSDAGATITVNDVNKRIQPFNNSSEDLAASGAANLALTTSYFSTAAAETATLAAGVNGQIKTFAMFADSGDMVITVTNAGWKTSGTGTITFDTIGDACTLQYINSKWFCIGNNGAVFA